MLNHDTRLFPHHVDPNSLYDYSQPVAEVAPHPVKQGVWGLRNRGSVPWTAKKPDGTTVPVPPGRSVSLASRVEVDFFGAGASALESLPARLERHRRSRLVWPGDAPLADARARDDPLVRCVHHPFQVLIGQDALWNRLSPAGDAPVVLLHLVPLLEEATNRME